FKDTLKALAVDATPHGFRSTFTDWAADRTNYPREVREQCLAHAIEKKSERAYRRGDLFEKRRRLMDAWADYCSKPAAGGKVLTMRKAAVNKGEGHDPRRCRGAPARGLDAEPRDPGDARELSQARLSGRPAASLDNRARDGIAGRVADVAGRAPAVRRRGVLPAIQGQLSRGATS